MYKTFLSISLVTASLLAQDFDEITVTATKQETKLKEVTSSIAVVDSTKLEQLPMTNINDALQEIPGLLSISKNGGYDTRLFIRGAGIKANYGIREIMILRDGIPMTDPDSFSRMDFIDMEDIKRIEVTKGPGSIYASGSSGGTINIIPFSVFDNTKNRIKIGYGSFNQRKANLKVGAKLNDNNYISLTASHQLNPNDWRVHNRYESNQASLKYGHIFKDSATVESELSYTKADLELPTSLTQSEFDTYVSTGKIEATSDAWQNSGRYSEILFFNSKYTKNFDTFTLTPKIFYNHWSHFHPVPFLINDSKNNHVFGTDIQIDKDHTLFSKASTFITGVTFRADISLDERKYKYRDYTTATKSYPPYATYITRTTSDTIGDLADSSDSHNFIYGAYLLENVTLSSKLHIDFSLRAEKADFDIKGNELWDGDWSSGNYVAGAGLYHISNSFNLLSSKLGSNYALSKSNNFYANIAYADQVPSTSELKSNVLYGGTDTITDLTTAKALSVEMGIKHRSKKVSFEANLYYNPVIDAITSAVDGSGERYFQNASKVDKSGSEWLVNYRPFKDLQMGASYNFSYFTFADYTENGNNYSGNFLPQAPKNQYTLFAGYLPNQGFSLYLQSITWGSYYVDNANTERYEGFEMITNMTLGYKYHNHAVKLMINNLFDQRYSVATTKPYNLSFVPATPFSAFINYTYTF